jgi:hypothetical protein
MAEKWRVGTPATAGRRGWCPHQPQMGETIFLFLDSFLAQIIYYSVYNQRMNDHL